MVETGPGASSVPRAADGAQGHYDQSASQMAKTEWYYSF